MYLLAIATQSAVPRDVARDSGDVAQLHRTVMRAFPVPNGETARAYHKVLHRLEVDHRRGTVTLYVQSQPAPNWEFLPTGYIIEQDDSTLGIKRLIELYEAISTGRRLRFRLRANVTRKIDTKTGPDGVRRHGRRVPLYGEQAQLEWLQRQGERNGFQIVSVATWCLGLPNCIAAAPPGARFKAFCTKER